MPCSTVTVSSCKPGYSGNGEQKNGQVGRSTAADGCWLGCVRLWSSSWNDTVTASPSRTPYTATKVTRYPPHRQQQNKRENDEEPATRKCMPVDNVPLKANLTVEPVEVDVWTPMVPFIVVERQEPSYASLELASSICSSVLPLLRMTDMLMNPVNERAHAGKSIARGAQQS